MVAEYRFTIMKIAILLPSHADILTKIFNCKTCALSMCFNCLRQGSTSNVSRVEYGEKSCCNSHAVCGQSESK